MLNAIKDEHLSKEISFIKDQENKYFNKVLGK